MNVVAENLGEMAEMQRFVSLMESDLSQAIPRAHRNERGDRTAAFAGLGEDGSFLQFTRGGQSNINERARSNLQRVIYRFRDDAIERAQYEMTDGGVIGEPALLLGNVTGLSVRFRDKSGLWAGDWRTERLSDLPRAIEIRFEQDGRSYRHIFLVGTGYL